MFVWRRRADPPSVWTYGTLVLHPDDVTFVDLEKQPDYAPPDLKQLPNLEAELAHSPAFVADLQDDAFALTAFFFLAKKEWIKIGHPNAETFSGESEIASMIAGLRGKGEIYLDIRYQTLGGRERPLERGLFTQGQIRRLNRHLTSIGWRTHTPDEIEAMLREDLIQRLCARMELLRQVKDLETRPAKTYPAWKDEPRWILPITIYREGDDPAWLGQLTADEQEACSGRLSLRISALATSARIDQDEYDRLISVLVR